MKEPLVDMMSKGLLRLGLESFGAYLSCDLLYALLHVVELGVEGQDFLSAKEITSLITDYMRKWIWPWFENIRSKGVARTLIAMGLNPIQQQEEIGFALRRRTTSCSINSPEKLWNIVCNTQASQQKQLLAATLSFGYKIICTFKNGKQAELSFKQFLQTSTSPLVRQYLDTRKFANFKVSPFRLKWDHIEVSSEWIYSKIPPKQGSCLITIEEL